MQALRPAQAAVDPVGQHGSQGLQQATHLQPCQTVPHITRAGSEELEQATHLQPCPIAGGGESTQVLVAALEALILATDLA